MSHRKDVLLEIARAINSGGPYKISDWFTENFRLSEPTKPDWPAGHAGALKLLENFNALTRPVHLAALDMVEEGDRVAVRWQLSATYNGEPFHLAMMAIYRFEDSRIAEDWGIPIHGDWP